MNNQHPFEPRAHHVRAQEALVKLRSVHQYAAEQLATTLASAGHLELTAVSARSLTLTQMIGLNQVNRALLWRLLSIVQRGGMSLVDALQYHLPVAQVERQIDQQIDQLVQIYLQHVQIILRRSCMTKKEANLLGLTPFPQAASGSVILYSPASTPSNPLTKAGQRIVVDTQKQILVIRSQREKADTATHEIAQVHQQGAQEFLEIVSHLSTLKAQAQGKEYQSLVEEFNHRSSQMAAQHLFGVIEVSARNIGMETARPLYRDEEPEVIQVVEKPSLLKRLLGD